METERIKIMPSEAPELLAEIKGGINGNSSAKGLVNERLSGGAKVKLSLMAQDITPIVEAINKARLDLIIKNGGTKEEGIPAGKKDEIKQFFKEWNEYLIEIDKEPEFIKRKQISLVQSGYLSVVSESDYTLALEKLFVNDQED